MKTISKTNGKQTSSENFVLLYLFFCVRDEKKIDIVCLARKYRIFFKTIETILMVWVKSWVARQTIYLVCVHSLWIAFILFRTTTESWILQYPFNPRKKKECHIGFVLEKFLFFILQLVIVFLFFISAGHCFPLNHNNVLCIRLNSKREDMSQKWKTNYIIGFMWWWHYYEGKCS